MLSQKIEALRDRLQKYAPFGLQATPEAVAAVIGLLDVFARDARALENAQVSPAARSGGGGNALRFSSPARRWPQGSCQDPNPGGDAA